MPNFSIKMGTGNVKCLEKMYKETVFADFIYMNKNRIYLENGYCFSKETVFIQVYCNMFKVLKVHTDCHNKYSNKKSKCL